MVIMTRFKFHHPQSYRCNISPTVVHQVQRQLAMQNGTSGLQVLDHEHTVSVLVGTSHW